MYSDIGGVFINFGNADFIQYGSSGSARENVAVEAGLWTAGDFIPTITAETNTIVYSVSGTGVNSWSETTEPTAGRANVFVTP